MSISWSVNLDDKVSAPADAAAKAMGEAAQKAQVLQRAIDSATNAVTKAAALGNVSGYRTASKNVAMLTEALSQLPPEARRAGQAQKEAAAAAKQAAAAEKVAAGEASEAAKQAAAATEKWKGALESVATAAVAAAAVVGAAFAAAIYEGAKAAIEASEGVKLLTAQFGALAGGGEEAGAAVLGMVRDLEKEIPQSEKVIGSWARSLMAAGVTDMTKLRDSLKAVAGAEALVEGGGEKVRGMLSKLNEASQRGTKIRFNMAQLAGTGVTEDELLKNLGMTPKTFELAKKAGTITGTQIADAMTKAINEKAAGPLADQMGELSTIFTKAKDAIGRMFEKVNIKPLIDGIKAFFALFDEANPSGQAIRTGIVAAFDWVFAVAGKVFAFLRVAFLQLIIWGLGAYLYMRPLVKSFEDWYAKVGGAQILMTALKGIGIVLGSLAVAFGIVLAVGFVLQATLVAIAAAIVLAVAYIIGLVPRAGEALGDLAYKAVEAGKAFIDGLVQGITNGVGLVVDAVKNLGKSAWKAITGVLDAHSPSRLMMQVGMSVPQGFAQGIEAGTPDVADAGASMGAAAVPRSSGGARGGVSLTVGDINITVEGGHHNAQEIGEAVGSVVAEKLGSLMEQLALIDGTAP